MPTMLQFAKDQASRTGLSYIPGEPGMFNAWWMGEDEASVAIEARFLRAGDTLPADGQRLEIKLVHEFDDSPVINPELRGRIGLSFRSDDADFVVVDPHDIVTVYTTRNTAHSMCWLNDLDPADHIVDDQFIIFGKVYSVEDYDKCID